MDAINDGTEIEVAYTVYGSDTEYKVTLKKTANGFEKEGEAGFPTDLDYTLSGALEETRSGLEFTLTAKPTAEWYADKYANNHVQTRGTVEHAEEDGEIVMIIKFDSGDNTYDVLNAPGFSFKVLSVKGLPVKIKNACSKTAKVKLTYEVDEEEQTIEWVFNHNGEKWTDFVGKYAIFDDEDAGDNGDPIGGNILFIDDNETIPVIDLQDYSFVYGYTVGGICTDADCEEGVNPDDAIEDEDNKTYYSKAINVHIQ